MSHRAALIVVAAACACGGEPSKEEQLRARANAERAKAEAACKKGDGPSCFVAAMGLDTLDKKQLSHSIDLWQRGCELGHGASCAQLGTVAEFGMTSGGAKPDPMEAARYYMMACKLGDARSCKDTGMPLPAGTKDPDAPPPFPWREALTPICGKVHGEMGSLFEGLVLGQPMSDAMKQQVAAFEKKYKARVNYYAGDVVMQSSWMLDVNFDEKDGLYPVLVQGWGKPDLAFGAWTSDTKHTIVYLTHMSEQSSGLSWGPHRTVAELIRPDDKAALGFEPFPVVGAKLVDVKAALGDKIKRSAEDEYQWTDIGNGPGVEIHVVEKHGTITELRTVNWITNSSEVGDALFAALETKWGKPVIDKQGIHTWKLPGRVVHASKPASGNFEIEIAKR